MSARSFRIRWGLFAVTVALLAAAAILVSWPKKPPFRAEDFTSTTRATMALPPPGALRTALLRGIDTHADVVLPGNPSVSDRFALAWIKAQRWRRSSRIAPTAWSFPGAGLKPCSIHGLLNQCQEITGNRYLIDKNAAAGSVQFGSTNTLNGEQWVAAFEKALQSDAAQWWDPSAKGFVKGPLVLIRYPEFQTVLVAPRERAAELQRR